MVNDTINHRYIVCEETSELTKYIVMEYDQDRGYPCSYGHILLLTQYSEFKSSRFNNERPLKYLETEIQEFHGIRNIAHFNCNDPFYHQNRMSLGKGIIGEETCSMMLSSESKKDILSGDATEKNQGFNKTR